MPDHSHFLWIGQVNICMEYFRVTYLAFLVLLWLSENQSTKKVLLPDSSEFNKCKIVYPIYVVLRSMEAGIPYKLIVFLLFDQGLCPLSWYSRGPWRYPYSFLWTPNIIGISLYSRSLAHYRVPSPGPVPSLVCVSCLYPPGCLADVLSSTH